MQLMQLDDGEDLDAIHEPDPKRQKIADVGPTHLNEETTVNPIGKTNGLDPEKVATSVPYPSQTDGKQQLRGGANWFKEKLAMSGLRAVIQNLLPGNHGLEDASASGVRQMLIRHSLIRACNCHVEVSADLSTADIFAKGWQAAFEAKKLFGLPDGELETTLLQQDAGAMPDGCEEEENLESVEMSWVRHAAHWSFSHDTVRPSYIDQKSQSLQPNLKSWTFKHKLDPVQARAIACVENGWVCHVLRAHICRQNRSLQPMPWLWLCIGRKEPSTQHLSRRSQTRNSWNLEKPLVANMLE